jgi:predicted transcriptional regulator YdeE
MRILTVVVLFTASLQSQPAIQIKKVEQFYVLGLSVRTDNAHEMTGQGKIGNLWRQFKEQNIGAGKDTYAVYSNYESDQNGAYNYLLGYKVVSIDKIPAGVTAVKIQAGNYAIVPSERGPGPKVVPEVWKRIWALTPTELTGPRAFKTDFELYRPATGDGPVDVFIGLR